MNRLDRLMRNRTATTLFLAMSALFTLLATGGVAFAAEGDELTETGFVPAPDVQAETIDGGALLLAAYAVAWVLIVAYVAIIAKRARGVQAEADAIRLLARDLDARLEEEEGRRDG